MYLNLGHIHGLKPYIIIFTYMCMPPIGRMQQINGMVQSETTPNTH